MFTRKPHTALTAKNEILRSHKRDEERQSMQAYTPILKPVNGYANINGFVMPF